MYKLLSCSSFSYLDNIFFYHSSFKKELDVWQLAHLFFKSTLFYFVFYFIFIICVYGRDGEGEEREREFK